MSSSKQVTILTYLNPYANSTYAFSTRKPDVKYESSAFSGRVTMFSSTSGAKSASLSPVADDIYIWLNSEYCESSTIEMLSAEYADGAYFVGTFNSDGCFIPQGDPMTASEVKKQKLSIAQPLSLASSLAS